LRPLALDSTLVSPNWKRIEQDSVDMARVRAAIHAQTKVALSYRDESGRETRRTIWPFAVSYWDTVRVVVAWCELRKDFRSFRTDRVVLAEFLSERYPTPRSRLTAQWRKAMQDAIGRGEYDRRKAAQQART